MKKLWIVPVLALPLALAGCAHPPPPYYPPPPPPAASSAAQQGFHDGFDAARRDIADNRPPRFDHHPRFRNPPVPPPLFNEYRQGFRDGYNSALHPAPPPPPGA